jgi:hypothetical protein
MYQYLAKYNLLQDAQSGFRSNNSCQTALINIIYKCIEEMNNGNVTLVGISEIFPPEMCIVESSAYISVLQFEILKGRSFIYKINNNGPIIEP